MTAFAVFLSSPASGLANDPVTGTVYKEACFFGWSNAGFGPPRVYKHALKEDDRETRERDSKYGYGISYAYAHKARSGGPYWCRISHGCYWAVDSAASGFNDGLKRVPLEEFSPGDDQKRGFPEGDDDHRFDRLSTKWDWTLPPLKVYLKPEESLRKPLYYDCLPTAPDSFLLFVLKDMQLIVWQCHQKKWSDKPVETIPIDLAEAFTVYSGPNGSYFFLTASSGKLLHSVRPEKGERKMTTVWGDAQSPIRILITDVASQKSFAFTEPAKDSMQGKSVYFELTEKPEPIKYERKGDQESELFKKIVQRARLLVAEKKISIR